MHTMCQICAKRPATTHLTELAPAGGRRELHICGQCVHAMGLHLESGPPAIATILEQHGAEAAIQVDIDVTTTVGGADVAAGAAAEEGADPVCPACGLTMSEYAANNLFGCSNDYHAFGEKLEHLLKRYHGATRHVGRGPLRPATAVTAAVVPAKGTSQRRKLESALKDAVARERYEDAAAIRDQLRTLEDRQRAQPPAPSPDKPADEPGGGA